jgi:hypothetical protein
MIPALLSAACCFVLLQSTDGAVFGLGKNVWNRFKPLHAQLSQPLPPLDVVKGDSAAPPAPPPTNATTHFFDQTLDHTASVSEPTK